VFQRVWTPGIKDTYAVLDIRRVDGRAAD